MTKEWEEPIIEELPFGYGQRFPTHVRAKMQLSSLSRFKSSEITDLEIGAYRNYMTFLAALWRPPFES